MQKINPSKPKTLCLRDATSAKSYLGMKKIQRLGDEADCKICKSAQNFLRRLFAVTINRNKKQKCQLSMLYMKGPVQDKTFSMSNDSKQ